jgi:hypothetical protein
MALNVLLVEDEPSDMTAYRRDLPAVFRDAGVPAELHPAETFDRAYELIDSTHIRYDMILSDTYRGNLKNGDAAVIDMVNRYRKGRFCPAVVFSASAKPAELQLGAFVIWADKAVGGDIERAIRQMLSTGIPQLARSLHDELDRTAGGFLWHFLEENWSSLFTNGVPDAKAIARLIRRRAALHMAEMDYSTVPPAQVAAIEGFEYYTYPPLEEKGYNLGHIVQNRTTPADIRVVLTPHCHLIVQQGQTEPRAKYVLTVKTVGAREILGDAKIASAKTKDDGGKNRKLKDWVIPPSGEPVGLPEGRYWYLPAFLKIPHSYCDFQQIESLPYPRLKADYDPVAVLTPPFAESLQACFVSYHAAVGIPKIRLESVRSLIDA